MSVLCKLVAGTYFTRHQPACSANISILLRRLSNSKIRNTKKVMMMLMLKIWCPLRGEWAKTLLKVHIFGVLQAKCEAQWATRETINERRHKRIVIGELITMNDTEPRVRVARDQTPTRTGVHPPTTRTGFQNPCMLCLYVVVSNIQIKGL